MLLGTLSHQKILLFLLRDLEKGLWLIQLTFLEQSRGYGNWASFRDIQLKYDKETDEGFS